MRACGVGAGEKGVGNPGFRNDGRIHGNQPRSCWLLLELLAASPRALLNSAPLTSAGDPFRSGCRTTPTTPATAQLFGARVPRFDRPPPAHLLVRCLQRQRVQQGRGLEPHQRQQHVQGAAARLEGKAGVAPGQTKVFE